MWFSTAGVVSSDEGELEFVDEFDDDAEDDEEGDGDGGGRASVAWCRCIWRRWIIFSRATCSL